MEVIEHDVNVQVFFVAFIALNSASNILWDLYLTT